MKHATRNKNMFHVPSSKFFVSGFTLIELIVAIGLFSIIVAIAIGGFIRALRTERQVIGLLAANSNASLAIEQMAREIRTGYDFCASGSCGSSELSFQNANGCSVSYSLQSQGLFRATAGGNCGPTGNMITASNVLVQYLNFVVSGNQSNDGYPPRITVAIGIGANTAGVSGNIVNLETTVSARVLDG